VRKIDKIILHCTDSTLIDQNAAMIRDWHINGNGWSDIGYHYFITFHGLIEVGRPLDIVGAHCPEQGINHTSIGICLAGKYLNDFTEPQFTSLYLLLSLLRRLSQVSVNSTLHGHKEFNPDKSCPVFNTNSFKIYWASAA